MVDRAVGVFVTEDSVIPRLSSSDAGWEVVFIQRKKEPCMGSWALPGGHLTTEDASRDSAAQREAREETGLDIPLPLFQQVHTNEDFEDSRGKYVRLLSVLSNPLGPEATTEVGNDASFV